MKDELDKSLCEKYPKIFKQRNWSMQETAMCWGFEHGDGWYNILDALCANIQGYIDRTRKDRLRALKMNRALRTGDVSNIARVLSKATPTPEWAMKDAQKILSNVHFEPVPEMCPQVVAVQVKEKFGGLRFYYDGGDAQVRAMVGMAESMAGRTCEVCGSPGESRTGGWIRTLCDVHAQKD